MVENNNNIIDFIDTEQVVNKDIFQEFEEIVVCMICQGIVIDPKECNECESHYCNKCLISWSKNSNSLKCPMKCSNPSFSDPSRLFKNMISKIELYCPKECGSKVVYDFLMKHVKECKVEEIDCPLCTSKVKFGKVNKKNYHLLLKSNQSLLDENSDLHKKNEELLKALEQKEIEIVALKQKESVIIKNNISDIYQSQLNQGQLSNQSQISNDYQNDNNRSVFDSKRKNKEAFVPIIQNENEIELNKVLMGKAKGRVEEEMKPLNSLFNYNEQVISECKHFERNFKIVFSCCINKAFNCKYDHVNRIEGHDKSLDFIKICNKCSARNLKNGFTCTNCITDFYSAKTEEDKGKDHKSSKRDRIGLNIYDKEKNQSDDEDQGWSLLSNDSQIRQEDSFKRRGGYRGDNREERGDRGGNRGGHRGERGDRGGHRGERGDRGGNRGNRGGNKNH